MALPIDDEVGQRHVDFRQILLEISTELAGVSPQLLEPTLAHALERIGRFVDCDACVVFLFSADRSKYEVLQLWTSEQASPAIRSLQEIPSTAAPWSNSLRQRGKTVVFSDLDQLPDEASKDRESFRAWGLKSIADIPLVFRNEAVGFMAYGHSRAKKEWSDEQLSLLELVAKMVANVLALHRAMAESAALRDRLQDENIYLREQVNRGQNLHGIVGASPSIESLLAQVAQVAPTDSTVLLTGETGTGKDLFAHALHQQSLRQDRPLVTVNCAALPESVVESELFGHKKGSFTGAIADRVGRFELADGGTLFLDEIGDLSPGIQAKLLRVLQEGRFEPVGSSKSKQVDVRLIAATHRDLPKLIAEERFRQDLFYRLSVFPLEIPPLRERRGDIPELARHFLAEQSVKTHKRIEGISREMMQALLYYNWPGNVRELRNVIERAAILTVSSSLDLPAFFQPGRAQGGASTTAVTTLDDVDRLHIVAILESCEGRVKGKGNAAELLGLPPSTLYSRMKKLGIERRK